MGIGSWRVEMEVEVEVFQGEEWGDHDPGVWISFSFVDIALPSGPGNPRGSSRPPSWVPTDMFLG